MLGCLLSRHKILSPTAFRERPTAGRGGPAKEEVLRRTRAETAVKESQLTLLRYQLNPHFLFNTLNSIYALIDKGDADQASGMVLNLSHFLRYSLEHGAERSVELPTR